MLKRVAVKIRSGGGPLIKDHENRLKRWSIGQDWDWNFRFCGLGETSEKGSTRKDTGNRVTRYGFVFLGEFDGLRCFTKRIWVRELRFSGFWDFVRRSTWGWEEGGPTWCFFCVFGGI
jgi:hypothetical protein